MNERYGLWKTVRDFWKTGKAGFVLFLISSLGIIYSYTALHYEINRGWNGHVSVQNVVKDISAFIPVNGMIVAIIIGGIDFIMLLSDWYLARQEKRIAAAKAEGKAEGIAEGKAEGMAAMYQEIAAWDSRRKAAEARGEPFTEPLPSLPQNGSEK